ncbi:uncharacterized protein LOC123306822 [Coccinella septempunctata]|uniref:uncharacterized protein LOC123306822 n=1 Tax=Coccinella septempunctata TaxID=41139 RepID=UPI001D060E32|nr:uncharacterized protein LOC123306822 [Coccinella septempunctata]
MPNKCFLCGFTYIVGGEISLHTLPTKPSERKIWLQRISWKEPLCENKKYYLCSNHFPEHCFIKINSRKRLIRGSLPYTINFQIPLVHSDDGIIQNCDSSDFQSCTEASSLSRIPLSSNTSPLNTSERLDTNAFTCQLIIKDEISDSERTWTLTSPSKCGSVCSNQSINKDEISDSERTWTLTSPSKCGSFCSSITYYSEEQIIKKIRKKRFLSNPRYIGDYTYRHMENPTLRKKFLRLSQRTISDLKKRNNTLTRQVRRLKNTIRKLQELAKNVR